MPKMKQNYIGEQIDLRKFVTIYARYNKWECKIGVETQDRRTVYP